MKRLLILLVILLASTWLGAQLKDDPGYVLFSYQHWTVEAPLWFAGALLVLTFLLLHFVIRLFQATGRIGLVLNRWKQRWRLHRSHSLTHHGLIELSEGDYAAAEKHLMKALPSSDAPLVNYLAAARAAAHRGDVHKREHYLREAQRTLPDATLAIQLTRAELQLAHQQNEQALVTLRHLYAFTPKHKGVLTHLHQVYLRLNDWESLNALLPELKRQRILDKAEYEKTQIWLQHGMIEEAHQGKSFDELTAIWKQLGRAAHKNPTLLAQYARALLSLNKKEEAEALLKPYLKKQWDAELISLYARIDSEQAKAQMQLVESWLPNHPHDPDLLLACARVSRRNALWGKARTYYENSLVYARNPQAFAELAELLEQLGESDAAQTYYRQGLSAATSTSKSLSLI